MELTELLLQHGANPNREPEEVGLSPLSIAWEEHDTVDIFSLLLRHGALPIPDQSMLPLLHQCAQDDGDRVDFLKPLVEEGAGTNVNQRVATSVGHSEHEGQTALHVAFQQKPTANKGATGTAQVIEQLLALGADPRARDAQGRTPWHLVQSSRVLRHLWEEGSSTVQSTLSDLLLGGDDNDSWKDANGQRPMDVWPADCVEAWETCAGRINASTGASKRQKTTI